MLQKELRVLRSYSIDSHASGVLKNLVIVLDEVDQTWERLWDKGRQLLLRRSFDHATEGLNRRLLFLDVIGTETF